MIDEFQINIKKKAVASPATENIFKADGSKPVKKNKAELFHTIVARGLILGKIYRPGIHPTSVVLCTRVKEPNQEY